METINVKSFAHYVPTGRYTNDEVLEPFRKSNQHRFTGEEMDLLLYGCRRKFDFLKVKTRSCCANGDTAVTMAKETALSALSRANLKPEEIDCIIFSGVNNPFREPSFAMVLAKEIGLAAGDFFDINDTCNGFLKSIEIASLYLTSRKYKNILIATSESPYEVGEGLGETHTIEEMDDIDRKFSSFFAGCGAGALVVSNEGEGAKITHYFETRETANWDTSLYTVPGVILPSTRYKKVLHGIWADPYSISALIINNMPSFILENLEKNNININDIDHFFTHQLGDNVTFGTLDKMGVARSKAPIHTFTEYGNLAAANLPVNLGIAVDRGLIKKGDKILLMSSACGLTFSCAYMIW